MKDILLIATYMVGSLEILLAFYFWKTNIHDKIRRVTGLVSFSAGAWVLLNALTSYRATGADTRFLVIALFISAIVLVTAFVHFSILFPMQMFAFDRLHTTLLYIPAVVVSIVIVFSNEIIKGFVLNKNITGYIDPGRLYPVFLLYLGIGILVALVILLYKARRLGGVMRHNTFLVFWSFFLPGIPAIIQIVFFESHGASYNTLITPLLTGIWVGITTYILMKR